MYRSGDYGLAQDYEKANELYLKAGELGCAEAYYNLGCSHNLGDGVEVDKKKANYYFELAAMGGKLSARTILGCDEFEEGNVDRAFKHFMISARGGCMESLEVIKKGFKDGIVSKDAYAYILRAHQKIQDEMKSDERDKAEAYFRRVRS